MLQRIIRIQCISSHLSIICRHGSLTPRVTEQDDLGHKHDDDEEADSVLVEKDKYITLIALNRPKQRNSINLKMAQRLIQAFQQFEEDKSSPVAVLYGLGGNLSAGYDLDNLEEHVSEEKHFIFRRNFEGLVGSTRCHLSKPIVCGINGYCVAHGLELALMCDLRVMEDAAILGFFGRRMGLPAYDGGSVRLPSLIGQSRALDLLLTGRAIRAKEALKMGLINRLVATGSALGQAVHLAFSVAKYPQSSLLHDRRALYRYSYERQWRQARGTRRDLPHEIRKEMRECFQTFTKPGEIDFKAASWGLRDKLKPAWELEEIELENAHAAKQNAKEL